MENELAPELQGRVDALWARLGKLLDPAEHPDSAAWAEYFRCSEFNGTRQPRRPSELWSFIAQWERMADAYDELRLHPLFEQVDGGLLLDAITLVSEGGSPASSTGFDGISVEMETLIRRKLGT